MIANNALLKTKVTFKKIFGNIKNTIRALQILK